MLDNPSFRNRLETDTLENDLKQSQATFFFPFWPLENAEVLKGWIFIRKEFQVMNKGVWVVKQPASHVRLFHTIFFPFLGGSSIKDMPTLVNCR